MESIMALRREELTVLVIKLFSGIGKFMVVGVSRVKRTC
jgi:hypothetical protein